MDRTIKPVDRLAGTLILPGDKSISHRALMIGGLAEGETQITNLSPGKDVQSTWNCLAQLGIEIEGKSGRILVRGRGIRGLIPPRGVLDAGNSGTTMRLLSGILSAQTFDSTITGDASLRERPMKRIIDPLREMGAHIEASDGEVAPLTIYGRKLNTIGYSIPVSSAQIKSCILLAGLYASGKTSVREPSQSRDHTERMLPCFGVDVEKNGLQVGVAGPAKLQSSIIDIPGDISSAAFFLVAASLLKGSELIIPNVGINPTRTGIIHVLQNMGGKIQAENTRTGNGEPRADIIVNSSFLHDTIIQGPLIPKIIDEIPILAVAATQAEGETSIREAGELRVKETDRIRAVAQNLRCMGVSVEELDDGLIIPGPQDLKGAVLESYGDHRIAMAFAVAGLLARGETVIQGAECAEISFPGFFNNLERIARA